MENTTHLIPSNSALIYLNNKTRLEIIFLSQQLATAFSNFNVVVSHKE